MRTDIAPITHGLLVKEAANWLHNSRRCSFVAREMVATGIYEIPDAIGWAVGVSVLVEVKTSRADFRRDRDKPHRMLWKGVGMERWYYAPAGVIPVTELPKGWGLLERKETMGINGYICRRRLEPEVMNPTVEMLMGERALLISAAWRSCEALSLIKPLTIGGAHVDGNV